ncbi:MAG: ABC transporter [Rhizobiales bacterium TMED249]|jgi:lipoprotein-releasing system ATP-binding protein|uniref:ABC transporter ATP-binding protein n=1 Tax=PS1 clade bacterium TaxID=2175152 RepID=A0A368DY19_9PROT|nr:MAG: ABC transporter [Rhizobiales bacterium TMED249]RCL76720.1 MAG: ABC transporter ATP-binding protein [PS1 clade bacterium]HAK99120.1 ABC transporter [Rhodobiaceae bacterium]HCV48245.1 ABC transporter [Rhodobiaceae bacterium]|tara:strand:- start:30681 stop:31364 length:684 start_codon:yes stop_codon:yes gene_type:complete
MTKRDTVLEITDLHHQYGDANKLVKVLNGVNFSLYRGENVALLGPSGAGKSTFLHLVGLLETAHQGSIKLLGQDVAGCSDAEQTLLRRQSIGFVYQFHNLLAEFTALENVMLPMRLAGKNTDLAREKAVTLLDRLNLNERHQHYPGQLSGGEQQRVAIARALANDPVLLLADEPTGNLDPASGRMVFELLLETANEHGSAALVATHNPELANLMDRQITLTDGLIHA